MKKQTRNEKQISQVPWSDTISAAGLMKRLERGIPNREDVLDLDDLADYMNVMGIRTVGSGLANRHFYSRDNRVGRISSDIIPQSEGERERFPYLTCNWVLDTNNRDEERVDICNIKYLISQKYDLGLFTLELIQCGDWDNPLFSSLYST